MQEALESPLQKNKTTRFAILDQVQVEDLALGANTSIKGDTIIIQPLGRRRKRKHNTKTYIQERAKNTKQESEVIPDAPEKEYPINNITPGTLVEP
jgi:hypothetical protein